MSANISFSTIVGMGGCGGPPEDKKSLRLVGIMLLICVPIGLIAPHLLISKIITMKIFLVIMTPCLLWSGGMAIYLLGKICQINRYKDLYDGEKAKVLNVDLTANPPICTLKLINHPDEPEISRRLPEIWLPRT